MKPSVTWVEDIIDGARQHGENEDPDHEVGDLQDVLRFTWGLLTEDQRLRVLESGDAINPLREAGFKRYHLLFEDPDTRERHGLGLTVSHPDYNPTSDLMDRFWDQRLDATGCRPVILQEDLE